MNSISELVESMEHLISEVPTIKDGVLTLEDDTYHSIEEEQAPLPLHSERKRAGAFPRRIMTNSKPVIKQHFRRMRSEEWLDYFNHTYVVHSTPNGLERSWNRVKPKEQTGTFKQERGEEAGEEVKGPRHYRGNSFGLNGEGLEFHRPAKIHTMAEEEEQQRPETQESADSMMQIEAAQPATNSTLFNESRISEDKTHG